MEPVLATHRQHSLCLFPAWEGREPGQGYRLLIVQIRVRRTVVLGTACWSPPYPLDLASLAIFLLPAFLYHIPILPCISLCPDVRHNCSFWVPRSVGSL